MPDVRQPIHRSYRDKGELRRVAQFSGDFIGTDPAANASRACQEVCRWLQKRVRGAERIPQAAFKGEPFEIDYPGHRFAAVRLLKDDFNYWSAKYDHPDSEYPGRSWMVEVGIASTDSRALFGLRLSCFDIGALPPPQKSTPGVLRQIVDSCGLSDAGVPFVSHGHVVGGDFGFDRFVGLLLSKDRLAPVCVITTENNSESPSDTALNASRVAHSCLGLMHVIVLPSDASYQLTNLLGKDFSVFGGAVRTYQPNLDCDKDSPSRHPLAMADTVKGAAPWGEGTFFEFLVERAYENSASAEGSQKRLPAFSTIKRIVSEERRKAATSSGADPEIVGLFEDAIESLESENRELVANAEEYDRLADNYRQEAEHAKRETHYLREEVGRLRDLTKDFGVSTEVEIPDSFDALPSWVEKQLVGRLVLHPRAVRMMKSARYEDVNLVYQALLILANEYRDMKMSTGESLREHFIKAVDSLGLEYSRSIKASRAPEQGATYFVEYQGNKCFLENHLKKGSTKDERHTMRIYYFWDDYQSVVVVGSLPGHLQTRAT